MKVQKKKKKKTRTSLQNNQRMRMRMMMMKKQLQKKTRKMTKRKLTKKPKLPRDTGKVREEATEVDTEVNQEDTTGDPTTMDLKTETTITVDIMSIQGMDITATEDITAAD